MEYNCDKIVRFQYKNEDNLAVAAEDRNLCLIDSWLDLICDDLCASQSFRSQVHIVVDEMFSNICKYAYKDMKNVGKFYLGCSYERDNNVFVMTFRDNGMPFNPLAETEKNVFERIAQKRSGGLGLLIVKRYSNSIEYERIADSNVLTIKKIVSQTK